ncbi:MAG: hypothetical protein ACLQPD_23785 [Desulfomonilaceae bacterium]
MRNTGPVLGLLSVGTLLNGFVNMPLYAQLAHGWTSLFLGVNIALVITLVPLLVFLSSLYGTLGVAAVWVLLNSCYVLITVQIMHGRILQGEKREWYLHDAGLVVALAGRMAMPENLSRVLMAAYMAAVVLLCFLAAVLAAPLTKTSLLGTARMLFNWASLQTS